MVLANYVRYTKFYTQKEWKKFKRFDKKTIHGKDYYLDVQELLCKKYDIILVDYKTRKEKTIHILKKFNMKNFEKGMTKFNRSVQAFSSGISAEPKKKTRTKDPVKIWSTVKPTKKRKPRTKNSVKIWETKRPSKKKQSDIEKIWGVNKWQK